MLTPLIWVALLVPPLVLLKRWIHEHLQRLGAALGGREAPYFLAYLLFLPGILLHELSHWLAARLLGVRTGRLGLWPSRVRGGWVRLGFVEIEPADPLRESLIGLAPFVSGTAAVLLIAGQVARLGQLEQLVRDGQWLTAWSRLGSVPDLGIWLYLIFATSNAMMPSPSDRRPWWVAGLFLVGLAGMAYLAGFTLPREVASAVGLGLRYLALALSVAVGVDLVFVALIWVLELALGRGEE